MRELIAEPQESLCQFGNAFVAGQTPDKAHNRRFRGDAQLISQYGGSLHDLRREHEARSIHSTAAAGTEDHCSLPACESRGYGLFAHAFAHTYNSMRKAASQTFCINQKMASQSCRGLEPQAAQRVEPTGYAV